MKRRKKLIVLSCILALAIVGIITEKAVAQHVDKINTIDESVFSISEDEVTQVAVTKGGNTAVIEKVDDSWKNTADTDFPVNQDYVAKIFDAFKSVNASFIIDDVEDYSQYGISNPEGKITFTTTEGTKEIAFGSFSTIDEKRYICVDGGSVYLIDTDLLEKLSGDVEDYLDRDKVEEYSQLTAMRVTGASKVNVVYDPDGKYTYTDTYDYYNVSDNEHQPLADSKVQGYLSTLSHLDLSKYETYKATEDDMAKYGLDNPTLTVTLTGEIAADDDSEDAVKSVNQTLYFSHKDGKDKAYLCFDGSTIVYTITAEEYEDILKVNYEDLRPDEVVSIDWTKVAQISAKIDGETNIVEVDHSGDGNKYYIGEDKVDFISVTSKIDGLTLTEAGEDYNKGTEELAFAITLDDDDATVVNVVMYQFDGDSCVVAADGKVVGLCDRSSMSNLREEITSAILNKGKDK
ncbi:DUF4340 domain-containing protein [Pseudobutyrivibrio xylanivorans]|uniref:DUF4340 domain-containing protein n=1 Tax=Pseudobutyrivibrio xylanivorans TaxID=185007 RepID=A0A1G5RVG0_PSEXY|nr:DUF4340 domain-containing protein [Pseudobutyrivibrio xylanivorans]SCZ78033.1 protein of unknown function [Pseudobutyrivibrio xylanivorans]